MHVNLIQTIICDDHLHFDHFFPLISIFLSFFMLSFLFSCFLSFFMLSFLYFLYLLSFSLSFVRLVCCKFRVFHVLSFILFRLFLFLFSSFLFLSFFTSIFVLCYVIFLLSSRFSLYLHLPDKSKKEKRTTKSERKEKKINKENGTERQRRKKNHKFTSRYSLKLFLAIITNQIETQVLIFKNIQLSTKRVYHFVEWFEKRAEIMDQMAEKRGKCLQGTQFRWKITWTSHKSKEEGEINCLNLRLICCLLNTYS